MIVYLLSIDRLSIISKSDVSDKIKNCGYNSETEWVQYLDSLESHWEKARCELNKNATNYSEWILGVAFHKTVFVWPHASNLKNELDILSLIGEVRTTHLWRPFMDFCTWTLQF